MIFPNQKPRFLIWEDNKITVVLDKHVFEVFRGLYNNHQTIDLKFSGENEKVDFSGMFVKSGSMNIWKSIPLDKLDPEFLLALSLEGYI